MSKFKKKKSGDLPAISTASLPDIVFMLLFFFMVATVMRENSLKIKNELPVANQVEKLDKSNICYIYIGKPSKNFQSSRGSEAIIQLDDNFAQIENIVPYINEKRNSLREELKDKLMVSLKVDKETNMGIVGDVKQELRKANALKINYTTGKGDVSQNAR